MKTRQSTIHSFGMFKITQRRKTFTMWNWAPLMVWTKAIPGFMMFVWGGRVYSLNQTPKVYPVLVQNRPYAHRMSYAASCNETNDRDGDNNQTVKFYASWFTNAAEDNSPNGEAYNNSGLEVDVPCGGLHPVLNHVFPSKRIHFFSLDTEGVEYSILQTINFNDIYIDIFIIESWNVFCKEICPHRENVRAFMQSKGYVLYPSKVTFSDLYVHAQSEYASRMSE